MVESIWQNTETDLSTYIIQMTRYLSMIYNLNGNDLKKNNNQFTNNLILSFKIYYI